MLVFFRCTFRQHFQRTRKDTRMNNTPYIITISHQLGSGGAYLGRKLSERLDIPFIDRQVLKKVSEQLNLPESALEDREERLSSFWESFSRMITYTDQTVGFTAVNYEPTDRELFQIESDYIGMIAEKTSAIILGRCGRYILRDHPRHISVLVHADMPARIKRIGELWHMSEDEAKKCVESNDRGRTAYIRAFAKQDWLDARLYDICIHTSSIGLDNAVGLVMACVAAKIP
jgi:cytidylate kinase